MHRGILGMKKLSVAIVSLFLSVAFLSSCGDDGGSNRNNHSFNQDVRHITYKLKQISFKAYLDSPSGAHEELFKTINYAPGESKDQILRLIDEANFVLMVNDKKAAV